MSFQAASKFVIVSVILILQVGVDRFTGPQQEIDIRYEFDFEFIRKALRSKWRLLQPFSVIFQITSKFLFVFARLILGRVGVDRFTGSQ